MPGRQPAVILLLCALALVASGCKKRTVHAGPPAVSTAPPEEPASPLAPAPAEVKPETRPETPPAPVTTPAPVAPPAKPAPPRPVPPQISPQISAEEQAAAERRTYEDIRMAERNLQVAYGKQLNAAQHDLVEKIRGFLGQSREAIRASDWVRARNLAQKARVLSGELVNSL